MTETIEVAIYEGKIICGFPTRNECKDYIKQEYPDIEVDLPPHGEYQQ